jgi:hypothetical protein
MVKENNIYFVRLLTGDDIIAQITDKSKTTYTLKNPMLIINNIELEEGRQTLILYPWIPQGICLGNTLELRIANVLFLNELEPEIIDYYEGIVLDAFATKPKLTSSMATKASDSGKNVLNFPSFKKDVPIN